MTYDHVLINGGLDHPSLLKTCFLDRRDGLVIISNHILENAMPQNTPIISTTPVSTFHKTFYIIGLSAIITCTILIKIYQT
jgi:hypothetical protein